MKFVILSFIIWRIFLFLLLQFSLSPWGNFDGVHYLTIAKTGYTTEGNFFPLFPLFIRFLSPIFGDFFAGLLIANLSFLIALIFLYKLIMLDFSSNIAKQSIIFLLIFPTSFYFGAIYTESLFLLLIVSSFYLARRNNWVLSSFLAIFASATRLVGIFTLPALLYQYVKKEGLKFSFKLFSLFLIPAGLMGYAVFNFYKWGDAFYFIKAHGNLANSRSVDSVVLFPQTIFRYFKILTDLPLTQYEWWIAFLEVSVFFIVSILLFMVWKKNIRREYLIFSILAFLLPVLSGTFSALPRYVITLFPIFIALALIKNKLLKWSYVIISPVILFILLMFFSRGYFVA